MSKIVSKSLTPVRQVPQKDANAEEEDMDISDVEEGGTRIGDIYIPPPATPYCSTESKAPRLIIRFIKNTNFKSYANEVVIGPFHHKFSAVVGPNGSGKSNVIDSMLFVFGYRAQQIRSKKLSVLIHNSSKYPNINSCKVSVIFQQIVDKEDGSFELLPNTEIEVSRTAFRNNSSFYAINGREVKFKQVAKLLSEHCIDLLNNRFLILQGEVESIAMMKPKALTPSECGLLEYLEDIIGTKRYNIPLLQIYERVEKLNEEWVDKHNRCRFAEREMKDLELAMTKALEYLALENQLYQAQNVHLQLYVYHKKVEVAKIKTDTDRAAQVLQEHDDTFEGIKQQRQEKEKIIQDEIKKHDDLIAKLEEYKSLEAKARNKHQRVDAKMKATNSRRKELKKQIDIDEKDLDDLRTLPERNNREIEESQIAIKRHSKEKTELEITLAKNLETLASETKSLQDEKEPLERELGVTKAKLDELNANYTEAEKELEIIKKDETTETRKFETLKYSFADTQKQLDEKKQLLNDLNEEIPQMKEEVATKQQEIQLLQKEETEIIADLRKVRTKLDENRTNMQMAQSNNRVLNALMKEKTSGRIPGILGRLGDLGGIDAKFDVAISTCCGRLDNIVVEDVNTAQKCIQFLKDHNVGRATFIALEKVNHLMRHCKERRQFPQNVPRLFDLIKVEDERVLPAFYFSLYDTLVANNMQQAREIAYGQQRFRVVTLTGEVIELTGTMSGGGKTQMRGRMGQKVQTKTAPSRHSMSERDLDALSVSAQNMQARINDCQHRQGLLEEEIKRLTLTIRAKEQEVTRLVHQVRSYTEQIPRLQEQLERQKKIAETTKSDATKVAALQRRVETCKFDHGTKLTEVDQIQMKVDGINHQIKEISDKKVKNVKQKIDKLTKQIENLTTNINKLTVAIRATDRNIQKTEERIQNATADVTAAENSLREMNQEREQFKEDSENLLTQIEQVQKEIDEATNESSSIKKEIAKIQKQEDDCKMKRLELDLQLKTLEKSLKEQSVKIPQWENKIKSLKLHAIPKVEMPDPPFKTFTEEELQHKSISDTQYDMTSLEEKLACCKPNLSVIDEYNKKQEVYMERVKILEDITLIRNEMRETHDLVKKKRFQEFNKGFQVINRKLKEMYQMITLGGSAELELVDSTDPFYEGIVFLVRPPKKSWKAITNLSGGEKTLASLALVFALHYYKPSPLYFMDEIDAALDFKNVSIIANYISERTKNAQFIIISLRSNMFEIADYLVGIYKVEDCTHSLTIMNLDKQKLLGRGAEGKNCNEKENQAENACSPQHDTMQITSRDQ